MGEENSLVPTAEYPLVFEPFPKSNAGRIIKALQASGWYVKPPAGVEIEGFKDVRNTNILLKLGFDYKKLERLTDRLKWEEKWVVEPVFRYKTEELGYTKDRKRLDGLGGATHDENDALRYWGSTVYKMDGIIPIPAEQQVGRVTIVEPHFSPWNVLGRAKNFFDFYRLGKVLYAVPNKLFLERFEPSGLEIKILNENEAVRVNTEEAVPQEHQFSFDANLNVVAGDTPEPKKLHAIEDKIAGDVDYHIRKNKAPSWTLFSVHGVHCFARFDWVTKNILGKEITEAIRGGRVDWYQTVVRDY